MTETWAATLPRRAGRVMTAATDLDAANLVATGLSLYQQAITRHATMDSPGWVWASQHMTPVAMARALAVRRCRCCQAQPISRSAPCKAGGCPAS